MASSAAHAATFTGRREAVGEEGAAAFSGWQVVGGFIDVVLYHLMGALSWQPWLM